MLQWGQKLDLRQIYDHRLAMVLQRNIASNMVLLVEGRIEFKNRLFPCVVAISDRSVLFKNHPDQSLKNQYVILQPEPTLAFHQGDAGLCRLELDPESYQWSLDVDLDLEGIVLVVEVQIAIADKNLGVDILYIEVVTERSKDLPGFVYLARVKDTVIATEAETPAVIELQLGIQADNRRVKSMVLSISRPISSWPGSTSILIGSWK